MKLKSILTVGILGIFSAALVAGEPVSVIRPSFRQMGMGGAGVAVVKDDTVLFVNPASITESGFRFSLFRQKVAVNQATITKASDLTTIFQSSQDGNKQDEQLKKLNSLIPATFGIDAGFDAMSLGIFGFMIGGSMNSHIVGQLVRPTSPTVKATGVLDAQYGIGHDFQFALFGQDMSLGATVKSVYRGRTYNADDGGAVFSMGTSKLLDSMNGNGSDTPIDLANGNGFGFDVGMKTKFKSFLGDTSGAIVFNNVGTSISGTKIVRGNITPFSTTIPMTTTLGIGFYPDLFLLGPATVAVDYKIQPDATFFKSIFMGIEKEFGIIKLRTGLYQGYPTAGVGLDLWILKGQYTYYTEESGAEVGTSPVSFQAFEFGLQF